MQEENSLAQAPQRRGAELVWTRIPLSYAVREFSAHVMKSQIGKEVGLHLR